METLLLQSMLSAPKHAWLHPTKMIESICSFHGNLTTCKKRQSLSCFSEDIDNLTAMGFEPTTT